MLRILNSDLNAVEYEWDANVLYYLALVYVGKIVAHIHYNNWTLSDQSFKFSNRAEIAKEFNS